MAFLKSQGNHEAAERIKQRVNNDLMMIKDVGYCSGMENYSRHLAGRGAGEPRASQLHSSKLRFRGYIDLPSKFSDH